MPHPPLADARRPPVRSRGGPHLCAAQYSPLHRDRGARRLPPLRWPSLPRAGDPHCPSRRQRPGACQPVAGLPAGRRLAQLPLRACLRHVGGGAAARRLPAGGPARLLPPRRAAAAAHVLPGLAGEEGVPPARAGSEGELCLCRAARPYARAVRCAVLVLPRREHPRPRGPLPRPPCRPQLSLPLQRARLRGSGSGDIPPPRGALSFLPAHDSGAPTPAHGRRRTRAACRPPQSPARGAPPARARSGVFLRGQGGGHAGDCRAAGHPRPPLREPRAGPALHAVRRRQAASRYGRRIRRDFQAARQGRLHDPSPARFRLSCRAPAPLQCAAGAPPEASVCPPPSGLRTAPGLSLCRRHCRQECAPGAGSPPPSLRRPPLGRREVPLSRTGRRHSRRHSHAEEDRGRGSDCDLFLTLGGLRHLCAPAAPAEGQGRGRSSYRGGCQGGPLQGQGPARRPCAQAEAGVPRGVQGPPLQDGGGARGR
mmetsp:Transcript_13550/g.53710  ORF Transcript_13550/g.53710 Transcript_13550/m.53710 type:complete len:482 (+) Transcript_13550:1771-3216(+)